MFLDTVFFLFFNWCNNDYQQKKIVWHLTFLFKWIYIHHMWNMFLTSPDTWSPIYGSEQDTAIDFQYAPKPYWRSQLIWIPELYGRRLRFPPQPDNTLRPWNVSKSQKQSRYLQANTHFWGYSSSPWRITLFLTFIFSAQRKVSHASWAPQSPGNLWLSVFVARQKKCSIM